MKVLLRKVKKLTVFLLIGGLIFPPQLLAQLANGVSVDVRAMALGNAMVADINPGISAVYHNPASLTHLKERHFEENLIVMIAEANGGKSVEEDISTHHLILD